MSELETRLGAAWGPLADEAGAAAFRLLRAFAASAERPGNRGWRLFRAARADVLEALAELEGRPLSEVSLRQRMLTLNTASQTLAETRDLADKAFRLRSERPFLVLELDLADESLVRRPGLDRQRDLAIRSTKAEISTRGLSLQTPRGEAAERTYLIAVDRGQVAGPAEAAVSAFLDALEHKLEYPPASRSWSYRTRLWRTPRDLAATGGTEAEQAQAAAERAHAVLLVMSDGWPDAHRAELDGRCLRVLASGSLADLPTGRRNAPVFPLLWSQQSPRGPGGERTFASLLELHAKGDGHDWDSFVSRIRDELLDLLDRVDSGETEQDRAKARRFRAAEAFSRASHESFLREAPEAAQDARATRAEGEGEPEELLPVLEAWANGTGAQSRVFALLGSFGTGKTTAAHMFAERLVEAMAGDPAAPFPVLLDLKRLSGPFDDRSSGRMALADMIVSSLHPSQARDIDAGGLVELLRSEPCVIIFDGLDEVGTRLGVDRTTQLYSQLLDIVPKDIWNAEAAARAVDWNACGARIMVTCRTQFFETYVQQKAVLTGHRRHTPAPIAEGDVHTTTYYMAPFSPDQVRAYFLDSLGAAKGREVYEAIDGIGDLGELVKKPLMTRYVAELAPRLLEDIGAGRSVNAGLVYQRLFEEALARDGFKQTAMTVRDRQDLLEALAEVFWRRRTPVLAQRDLESWFDGYMAGSVALGNILKSGVAARGLLLTELRNASLLMRRTNDGFGFDHTSFQEYFLARRLLSLLLDGGLDDAAELPPVSAECLDFLRDHVQSEGLHVRLGRALDRMFLGGGLAARALAMELVRPMQELAPAWSFPPGADLSGLDLRDRSFASPAAGRRRFRRVSFVGSNLLNAGFSGVDFEDCDFSQAVLWGARLEDCRFDRCAGPARGAASTRTMMCRFDEASRTGPFRELVLEFPASAGGGRACRPRVSHGGFALVRSAVFSPDGTQVLTASDDGTARLFDRAGGTEIARFTGHEGRVRSAVFSPDGTQVLTASYDGTARLFDRAGGTEIARFTGHEGPVRSAVFSPDGTQVLTAAYDGTARLFDRAGGTEIARFPGHEGPVLSAVFSPDGTQVLTASYDGTARLFDRAGGTEIARFTGHEGWVQSAVFSPDGTQVLTASDDGTARLFDRAGGTEIARFPGHEGPVLSAVFSPDGTQVLTACDDGTARLFDRAGGTEIARFTGHEGPVLSAVFSPDGTQVLTACDDGTARLFDRAGGTEIARFTGHEGRVRSAVFSPDGTQVLTACDDGTARLFDRAGGTEIDRFTGHERGVRSAVFSPDGTQVLTAAYDGTARLFDRAGGTEIASFIGHEDWVRSAVFSPDGTQVLTACDDRTAKLFDRAGGTEIARFTGHEGPILSAVFSPDGTQVLTACDDRTARLFDRAGGTEIARFTGHEDWVRSVVFSPDGTQVLTASTDRTARLFDRAGGTEIARFTGHEDWVRSAVFSPDGTQVLTASDDGTARLFDRAGGTEIARFGHEGWVRSAVFSPDGTQVLTACDDGTARLFDRAGGAPLGGWAVRPGAWMAIDAAGDIVRGGGALWRYVYGLDRSGPWPPKVVCPDLALIEAEGA